jgi:transporter family protein
MWNDYRVWAILSAVFAGLTAVLAKKGVENVPSNLALFIRVCVVVVLAGAIVLATKQTNFAAVSKPAWLFLSLSAVGTGASWLCYFRALQTGPVSRVAPIDKLSFVVAMLLGMVFLRESPTWKTLVGAGVIVIGVMLTLA